MHEFPARAMLSPVSCHRLPACRPLTLSRLLALLALRHEYHAHVRHGTARSHYLPRRWTRTQRDTRKRRQTTLHLVSHTTSIAPESNHALVNSLFIHSSSSSSSSRRLASRSVSIPLPIPPLDRGCAAGDDHANDAQPAQLPPRPSAR